MVKDDDGNTIIKTDIALYPSKYFGGKGHHLLSCKIKHHMAKLNLLSPLFFIIVFQITEDTQENNKKEKQTKRKRKKEKEKEKEKRRKGEKERKKLFC